MFARRPLQSLRSASIRPIRLPQPQKNYTAATSQIRFDQTKTSNDPSKGMTSQHKDQSKNTHDGAGGDHPAKQPDPQQAPSKSTGVRTDGPDGKAGEGQDKGVTKDDTVAKWIS